MKKAKIIGCYTSYVGQVGKVIEQHGSVWKVEMDDGKVLNPYSPMSRHAQCELVPDEPEAPKPLPIFN